jgi:hypothetical protein
MSYAHNASNYGHQTRRMAAASPVTQSETDRQSKLYATYATLTHLFPETAERQSALAVVWREWYAAGNDRTSTPSVDFLVETMERQIETRKAQLMQEGDEYSEPTRNDIQ